MKPKPDEALNTKFSREERSLLICRTTFKISKFEKWPHPVRAKTKMDFHVSLGFHAYVLTWRKMINTMRLKARQCPIL